MERLVRRASTSVLRVECLSASPLSQVSDTTRRRQKESLENALWRGVTQYYALEGHYPETLDDLTENCGIQYDKKQFFIDYQIAGANILPDITVIER